ncbi:hypothetical protein EUGRSUZ_L00154 [Eucalyptus grandis]|uniref:Pollen Ole e 1 allergen and extensin family protein n=2 Tax=Eucalyptus grandis TaxID=71139 RepID=A0A058ZXB1_EUCGR|nr:hypothetical protein EUGRSUZ_L00154 [Eucalyptus grandis]
MTIFFIFFIFLVVSDGAASTEGSLLEFSSQDELVEMAGYGVKKVSTVLVAGSVSCVARLPGAAHHRLHAWPVSGALVGVKCQKSKSRISSNWTRGSTDEFGDFTMDLPSHLHAVPDLPKKCSVRLLRVPRSSPCRPTHGHRHKRLKLASVRDGVRTYKAGNIRLVLMQSSRLAMDCGSSMNRNL